MDYITETPGDLSKKKSNRLNNNKIFYLFKQERWIHRHSNLKKKKKKKKRVPK